MFDDTITIFYFTCSNIESAQEVTNLLIEKSLIGCANIINSLSIFSWNNKIENSNEVTVIAKTANNCAVQVERFLQESHEYQIPCILHFNVKANSAYKEYLESVVAVK